jgi:hypothetical protein
MPSIIVSTGMSLFAKQNYKLGEFICWYNSVLISETDLDL